MGRRWRCGTVALLCAIGVSSCARPTAAPRPLPPRAQPAQATGAVRPDVRTFDLVAAPTELALVDGKPLTVWAYNGQVPGPTLRIRLGETLRVRFTNQLPQDTTIHWHGVRLPNAMDGVPYITQQPVRPGETFVYEFTPKDAGTFWFHPHVRASEQIERGLYGVLVVEDVSPPPYSREIVWVLDDWRLDETGQIAPLFNTRFDLAMDGRWGNAVTINGRTDTVLHAHPGERLRLRLLNSSNARIYVPDFGDLDATIIAVDALYLRTPIAASGFELAPGNRIDVDLVIDRTSSSAAVTDRFLARRPERLARIEIDGATVDTPRFASPASAPVPRWSELLRAPIAHTFHLNTRTGGPLGISWLIDGVAMDAEHHHGAMTPSMRLTRDRLVRLHFTNESARFHPIHMHGMFFRLLARNGTPVDEPFFRDTVLIHPREDIDVAVSPSELGTWMMHCHILEHAEAGMMTTIEVIDR